MKIDNKKRKRLIKSGIKKALKLPGMESHINRKKSYWKKLYPSDETLESWLRFRVVDMISQKLYKEDLSDLVEVYNVLEKRHRD